MNKKIICTAIATLALTSSLAWASTTQQAQAAYHSINSSYWNKTRKVDVTKAITFRKYDKGKFRFTNKKKRFHVGDTIKVRAAGEFVGWVLPGKPGSRYWWVSSRRNTNWMDEYFPLYKDGWKGNTYRDYQGSTLKVKKVENLTITDPEENDKPMAKYVVIYATFTNNYFKQTPYHYMKNNMALYPEGKTWDDQITPSYIDHMSSEIEDTLKEDSDKFDEATDALPRKYYTTFAIPYKIKEFSDSYIINDILNEHPKTFTAISRSIEDDPE